MNCFGYYVILLGKEVAILVAHQLRKSLNLSIPNLMGHLVCQLIILIDPIFLHRTIKGVDTSRIKSANTGGDILVESTDTPTSSSLPRLGVETELEEQLEKVRSKF